MSRTLFCLFDDPVHFAYGNYIENCIGSLKFFHADAHVVFVGRERSIKRHEDILSAYEHVNSLHTQVVSARARQNKFIRLDNALSYAKTHQYDYVYLLPSTFQFIDDPSEFLSRAIELLQTRDDVAMVCGDCVSDKIFSTWESVHQRRHEWKFDESSASFNSMDLGFHESGLLCIETLNRYGFRFGNGVWRAINSWWLLRGLFAYVFHAPITAKIPWIKRHGFTPTINPVRGEFILVRKFNPQAVVSDRPVDWQSGCRFRHLPADFDPEFWNSPEQYTTLLLQSNGYLRTIRKIAHTLLPRHLRLFFHMVCEK
jgi:hypothetical protein